MKIQVGDQVFDCPEKLSHMHDARYDASMLPPSRVVGAPITAKTTLSDLVSDLDCTQFSEAELKQMRDMVLTPEASIIIGTALTPSRAPDGS